MANQIFETINYQSVPWLEDRTILLVRHGSHAYGLNTPESDEDFKGIAIPPKAYFNGFMQHFEQFEAKIPDLVIYDIRKFFNLAADCNPNIIELLFGADDNIIQINELGKQLITNRDLFITKKARHTFHGYAISQLKRINTHRRWLLNPLNKQPERSDFDLPERALIPKDQLMAAEAFINKKLDEWQIDGAEFKDDGGRIHLQNKLSEMLGVLNYAKEQQYFAAGKLLNYDKNFMDILFRERSFKSASDDWDKYQGWLKNRNPKRAELERKFGYDLKHASHLVRLIKMCLEILETGQVIVKRPDREELMAIKTGAWTYEQLIDWTNQQETKIDLAYKNSKLPNSANRIKLDQLCQELVEKVNGNL